MGIKLRSLLFFLLIATRLIAQPEQLSDQANVSVITCGQGTELYSVFGHTAIRFSDPSQSLDVVFNYGTFDFDTPNFYPKFVKGDLMYFLSVSDYSSFVSHYQRDNRSVQEQFLQLSTAQKQAMWQNVLKQFRGPEKYYPYRFVDNNCTTKVVDLINEVLPLPIQTDFETNNQSYRKILNSYVTDLYAEKLGINILFGSKTDEPNQHVFMPDKLFESLAISTNGDQALVAHTNDVFAAREVKPSCYNSWWFACIVALIFIGLSCFSVIRKIIFVVSGLLGVLLVTVHFYSNHSELLNNATVMLLNPLYLVYVWIKDKSVKKYFLYMLLIISLLFVVFEGWSQFLLFLPILGTLIASIYFEKRSI